MQKAAIVVRLMVVVSSSLEEMTALAVVTNGLLWFEVQHQQGCNPRAKQLHLEKIGCLDQRLLQWALNKEPPDYNSQSHLRLGIIKGPLQQFE